MARGRVLWSPWLDSLKRSESPPSTRAAGAGGERRRDRRGPPGDRYFGRGDITLVEAEALEAFREDTGIELSHAEIRRQVLTAAYG